MQELPRGAAYVAVTLHLMPGEDVCDLILFLFSKLYLSAQDVLYHPLGFAVGH